MAVGFRTTTGVDIDTIFTARTSAKAADVGYRNSSGVDLSNLFEPYNGISPAANTGLRTSAGVDLAAIFATSPSASVVSRNYYAHQNGGLNQTSTTCTVLFTSNGTATYSSDYSGTGATTTVNWYTPTTSSIGAQYDIAFTSGSGTISGVTGTRMQLSSARSVSCTASVPVVGQSATRSGSCNYTIYNRSTNAVVATGVIELTAIVGNEV